MGDLGKHAGIAIGAYIVLVGVACFFCGVVVKWLVW